MLQESSQQGVKYMVTVEGAVSTSRLNDQTCNDLLTREQINHLQYNLQWPVIPLDYQLSSHLSG